MNKLADLERTILRDWNLRNVQLQAELCSAVHVLGGFILQRAAHRVDPEMFSDWYTEKK